MRDDDELVLFGSLRRGTRALSRSPMRQMVRGITKTEDWFDVIQEEQTESQYEHGDVSLTAEANLNTRSKPNSNRRDGSAIAGR